MVVDCCVILITILFPPAGVFLLTGCGADLCINLCLTFLGYLPGHLHAFYIMLTREQPVAYVAYQEVPVNNRPSAYSAQGYSQQGYSQQGPPRTASQSYYQPPPTPQEQPKPDNKSYPPSQPPPPYKQ